MYKGLVPHTEIPPASTTSPSLPTSVPPPPTKSLPSPATSSSPAPSVESPSAPPVPPPESPSSPLVAPEPSTPAPVSSPVLQPTQAKVSVPSPEPSPSPSPSPKVSGPSGPGFSSAVAYTPYNADQSCKSTSQVAADFQRISGYEVVRLYGTDCNQISNVIAATHGSVKLFLGIFDINSIQSEVQTISSVLHTFVLFPSMYPSSTRRIYSDEWNMYRVF